MSEACKRHLSLAGIEASRLSDNELRPLVRRILEARTHGRAFSPGLENQEPGAPLSSEQIRVRLEIIQPHVHWIRTFCRSDGNEQIPELAAQLARKSVVGGWRDDNLQHNELELADTCAIAQQRDGNFLHGQGDYFAARQKGCIVTGL